MLSWSALTASIPHPPDRGDDDRGDDDDGVPPGPPDPDDDDAVRPAHPDPDDDAATHGDASDR
jgi:hypothetical protein